MICPQWWQLCSFEKGENWQVDRLLVQTLFTQNVGNTSPFSFQPLVLNNPGKGLFWMVLKRVDWTNFLSITFKTGQWDSFTASWGSWWQLEDSCSMWTSLWAVVHRGVCLNSCQKASRKYRKVLSAVQRSSINEGMLFCSIHSSAVYNLEATSCFCHNKVLLITLTSFSSKDASVPQYSLVNKTHSSLREWIHFTYGSGVESTHDVCTGLKPF